MKSKHCQQVELTNANVSDTCSPSPHSPSSSSSPSRLSSTRLQRARANAPIKTLEEVVRQYGTPTYAYDINKVLDQFEKLQPHLPAEVEVLYSLKANASLGLSGVLAELGLGADVASAGELLIAQAAGFSPSRIFLTGPDKSRPVLAALRSLPEVVVSLDSVSELRLFAESDMSNQLLLRLRPDFCSLATCSTGPDSRFGLTLDDLQACRPYVNSLKNEVVGFHIFSGSQVLAEEGIAQHLSGGLDMALHAAEVLNITPEIIDIGGGFGIPYGPDESELDLAILDEDFDSLVGRSSPARVVIELGRYFVAQAGWYLTTVLGEQTRHGRKAVVVDGGSHQRADLCGVGLRHKVVPLPLNPPPASSFEPTDVLGCLSLPEDVLVEAGALPPLSAGDVLAFPNAGAYGLYSAPCLFHAHPLPAEVAFDGHKLKLLRSRKPIESVLDGQNAFSRDLLEL